MDLTITEASLADAHEIAEIEASSFTDPWSEKSIEESLASSAVTTYKAVSDGMICGYASLMSVSGEGELINIAVRSYCRKNGIGQALMDKVAETAMERGIKSLYLEVRSMNIPARAMYEKNGFGIIGVRRTYYRNPSDDAIIMKKTIEEKQ